MKSKFIAVLLTSFTGSVLAQSTEPPFEPSKQQRRAVVEEIMVTAQKREESLQDVPISVFAMNEQMMDDANIENLQDVAAFTPNLSVYSNPPFTSVSVRGLGSPFDKGFEHSAGLFLDGVYVGRLAFLDSAFLDVASVEVLRGPQGSLFGKNTISGALSIRSVQPTDEFEGKVEWQSGDREYEKYTVTVNAPVTDSIALRGSFLSNNRNGATYNTTLDRDEGSTDSDLYRIQARWDVNDWLNIRAATTDLEQNFRLGAFQITTATDDQFQLMQSYDPQVDRSAKDRRSSQDYPTETTQDGFKHDLVFNATLWDHEFSWINSINHIEELSLQDLDFSPIPLLFFLNGEDYDQISTELRIVSPLGMFDGKLDYVTGIYLAKSQTDIQVIIDAAPNPSALQAGLTATPVALDFGDGGATVISAANGDEPAERLLINGFQEGKSSAIYGQATWHFTDQLALTGGMRYSKEDKAVDQTLELFSGGTDADGPVFTQAVRAEEYRLITSRVDEDLSLKLALTWDPTDDYTLYASVAEGFKGGGYSGSAVRGDIVEVEPESSITAEIGAKSRILDGAATVNLAVFYTEFEELQLTIFEGSTSLISNAAGAISQGVELDTAFATPWGITGSLSMAYLDATFTDYTNGPCPAGEDTPCDVTGKPLARAPQWKGSFSANYFNDIGELPINLLVGFDYLYQDDTLFNADQDPNDFQEAYATTNYRVRIADDEERWSVQALLRNATNKHAIDSAGDVPTLTGAHFGRSIAPRTLDVTVQLRF